MFSPLIINRSTDQSVMEMFRNLGVYWFRLNIFSSEGCTAIKSLICDEPVYLLCDNGNKVQEFATFAQFLMPGSMISVHDWMYEIFPRDTDGVVSSLGLEPFEEEGWLKDHLRMATWSVPDRGQRPIDTIGTSVGYKNAKDDVPWHRSTVGGMYAEMGKMQIEMLKEHGLQSNHRFLDVGCGSLRLGVKAIEYLNHSMYCGVDCDEAIVKAGIKEELSPELRAKNPTFDINQQFDFSPFGEELFDMATAHSVFTHLPPHAIEKCMRSVCSVS